MTSDWSCRSILQSEMQIWFRLVTMLHETTPEACIFHSKGMVLLKKVVYFRALPKSVCVCGGGGREPGHCDPSEPGPEHNLVGASAICYVSKIALMNTIAIYRVSQKKLSF